MYTGGHGGRLFRTRPERRRLPRVHSSLSCRERGIRLIDEQPRIGIRDSKVAFLHPASTGGVLVELVQPAEGH